MNLITIVDDLIADIHAAQMKTQRLGATRRRFQEAVKCTLDLLDEITIIMNREGVTVLHYEDIPEKLKELIAKLKEGSNDTP